MSTEFSNISVGRWRQFDAVDIDFHPRLTVLTGANASGKTTILNLLGRHFNWQSQLLGVPRSRFNQAEVDPDLYGRQVGALSYTNGAAAGIVIQSVQEGSAEQPLHMQNQQQVTGLFLSSHRTLSRYQQLLTIPASFSTSELVLAQFINEVMARYTNSYTGKSAMVALKESLIAAALYGEETASIQRNDEAHAVWLEYQDVLRLVLPKELGFQRLIARPPEVIMITDGGEFLLDAVSGGISSIIEVTWQIYLRSRSSHAFTVCMDEPENHLHPSLQRSFIPGLLDAFPAMRFIVASHSPFIVTSVEESHIYALASRGGRVTSMRVQAEGSGATADDTLTRVLGLPTTAPIWVEKRLDEILDRFRQSGATKSNLDQLYNALQAAGLQRQFPAAVDSVLSDGDR